MIRGLLLNLALIQLFCMPSFGTNLPTTLKGTISGESLNDKIEFANIILLTKDSVFHSGCITDSLGQFTFKNIIPNDYIVKVSYIGYLQKTINYSAQIGANDMGNIFLQLNNSLQEVVVSARQVKYKTENGKIITNVANTDLRTIGSALDVLENVPGLTADGEKVNVFGKGEPIVYVNNRKLTDIKELERYRSTDIKNVELITNPSAKYAADGRSVLIINLNSMAENNMAIQAMTQYKQGIYATTSDLIDFYLKQDRVNIFANYMYVYQKNDVKNTADYRIRSTKDWLEEMTAPHTFQYTFHNVTTGVDWDITEKQVLGTQYQGRFSPIKIKMDGTQKLYENDVLFDDIATFGNNKDNSKRHLLNLFYNNTISEKFKIGITADYLYNSTLTTQKTEEVTLSETRFLDIEGEDKITLFTARTNAEYKINGDAKIEFGLDYSKIDGEGHYLENKNLIEKNTYSTFENKNGAYLSYTRQIKEFDINLGLRYEYSKYEIEESDKDNFSVKKHNLFPYFAISKTIHKTSMNLSFSKKIRRPSFSELNSNSVYVNKYLLQKGDPNLKAEDIYTINYLLGYKILNINLGYTYIKNPISHGFIQKASDSPKSLLQFSNYPKAQRIELFSTITNSIGIWKQTYSIGITQPIFKITYLDKVSNRNKANFAFTLNNDFKLFGDFITSVNFSMNTNHDRYIIREEGQKRVDFRLRKSFLKDKLNVSLYARDVFNLEEENSIVYVDQFSYDDRRKRNNRYVALTVQLNLNDLKSKYRGKNVSSDDLKRF